MITRDISSVVRAVGAYSSYTYYLHVPIALKVWGPQLLGDIRHNLAYSLSKLKITIIVKRGGTFQYSGANGLNPDILFNVQTLQKYI